MKVLDVQQFHEGLHRNIEKLNRLEEEIQGIKQAVDQLVLLEDALRGEGGNAIRSFYQESHLPLLNFFISFKSRFADTLRRIGEALNSFEPDRMGYIRQEFLEGEVQAGLEEIRRITGTLTDETNSIMDSVADIVSLPHLDDSEVQEGVRSSERQRDSTIGGLMEFDPSQTAALSIVDIDLKKMEQWIIDVESMMTEGMTGVDFPADSWKAVTARHPLRLSLTAHEASIDGLSNMSPFNYSNMISGANSYQLTGMATYGQPLYPMGIAGVNASPVPALSAGERIRYGLKAPAHEHEGTEENSVAGFFKDAGDGALKVGKGVLDFLILDDIKTLGDSDASIAEKALAGAALLPGGKLLKGAKLGGELLGISKASDELVDISDLAKKGSGTSGKAKQEIPEIITDGSHMTKGGKLKPNVQYKTGEYDYIYKTDDHGRISEFKADNLQLTKRGDRLRHNPNSPGKQDGDHAGHLAGDRFGGSPELDNIVSQLSKVNLSSYKRLENKWAKSLDEKKNVSVDVRINYDGSKERPASFDIEYFIDGEDFEPVRLRNK